jgi:RNA polymerase sigma-70 factor (ECF subfamily)
LGKPVRHRATALGEHAGATMAELVSAARHGDRSAFNEIVRRTYGDTYTLAYRLTGNEEDACDVAQEAYLRAFRSLRRFRGEARFSTWMYRLTANCAANLMVRRARHRHEELDEDHSVVDPSDLHDPETRVTLDETRVAVSVALRRLPWRLRQVIVLRDIYDLSHRAVAEELGITEAAAKVRLHRARRRLREDWVDREGALRGYREASASGEEWKADAG